MPRGVRLEPAGKPLRGSYRDGVFLLELPRLDLYDIVTWEG